jgi:hypothetical protein
MGSRKDSWWEGAAPQQGKDFNTHEYLRWWRPQKMRKLFPRQLLFYKLSYGVYPLPILSAPEAALGLALGVALRLTRPPGCA